MGWLGIIGWMAALGSWGYQAYWWIQHASWKPLPLNAVLHIQSADLVVIEWQWIVQIVVAVLDWNLGICLAVLGTFLFMVYMFQED